MHPAARALRAKLAAGQPVFGIMLVEFTGPAAVTAAVTAGMDFLFLDHEHGNQTPREIESTIEAGWHAGLCTILRPPDANRAVITRGLDAGAGGILAPMCATLDDVRQVVRASKYPPVGQRGTHLMRGHTRHQPVDAPTFLAEANRDLFTIIQIELTESLHLVDQIAAMDGVDGLYIGPGDLSTALGIPGQWRDAAVLDAIRATSDACRRHGKIMGCHLNDLHDAAELRTLGVQLFGYACDIAVYQTACRQATESFHACVHASEYCETTP